MDKEDEVTARDKKRQKRNRMIVDGKSVFTIQNTLIKKGNKKKNKPLTK